MNRNGNVAPGVIVRTENLTKTFVGIEALKGLGLEVPEGAVFALIGPNGAGKTTADIYRKMELLERACPP